MKGKLTIVSTGPGIREHITPAAVKAISECDVIVGYKTYLEFIEELIEGKKIISTGMRQEVDRCSAAIKEARNGNFVSLISGGDAGVYGLAGLVLELLTESEKLSVNIVPGVTSATACAALLGAPLTHDFAVISLSNLLTESDLIKKRLRLAAEGDFVTVLYNPKSKKRTELFFDTAKIFLKSRSPITPVGLVRNAYRESQSIKITTLVELKNEDWVDMRTTIVIGNSQTIVSGKRMITPRGYRI